MSLEQSITQHDMKKTTYGRLRPFLGPASLLAIIAIFGSLYPDTFLSPTNLVTNILESVAFVGIVAAAQTVVSSLAYYASDGKPVYGLVERNFVDIARGTSLGLSNKIWIMLVFAAIIWFILDQTPLGRRMYAVGGNPEAARYSGINTKLIRMIAFTICGVGAALGGLLGSASTATANVTATQPFMLNSIAAVFIGMAMFRNGKPNLPGTLLGVITLRTLENGLNFTSINDFLQSAITGAVVVIAVIPSALSRIRQSR